MVLWQRAFPSVHSHIFEFPLSGYIRADGAGDVADPGVVPDGVVPLAPPLGAVVGVVSFEPGTVVALAPGVAEVVFNVDIVGVLPVGVGVDPLGPLEPGTCTLSPST